MKAKKLEEKKESGITLVALIITIIILVILATISILAVYRAKILEYAINGSQDYLHASIKENVIMNGTESVIDSTVDKLQSILTGKKGPDVVENTIVFEIPKITELKAKSVTINIKATTNNEQKIKYKLYIGTTKDNLKEEMTLDEVESGNEITLTAKELSPNTTYYYSIEIVAKDNNTVNTEISSFKTKELSIVETEINIPQTEYCKYDSKVEARIAYQTDSPIKEDTIIKDETIRINNKDGANAQIESIQNYGKESLVTIQVGNSSGEFTLEVASGIKNEDGETVIRQESNKILVGTEMQRMISSITSTPTHYERLYSGINY